MVTARARRGFRGWWRGGASHGMAARSLRRAASAATGWAQLIGLLGQNRDREHDVGLHNRREVDSNVGILAHAGLVQDLRARVLRQAPLRRGDRRIRLRSAATAAFRLRGATRGQTSHRRQRSCRRRPSRRWEQLWRCAVGRRRAPWCESAHSGQRTPATGPAALLRRAFSGAW